MICPPLVPPFVSSLWTVCSILEALWGATCGINYLSKQYRYFLLLTSLVVQTLLRSVILPEEGLNNQNVMSNYIASEMDGMQEFCRLVCTTGYIQHTCLISGVQMPPVLNKLPFKCWCVGLKASGQFDTMRAHLVTEKKENITKEEKLSQLCRFKFHQTSV